MNLIQFVKDLYKFIHNIISKMNRRLLIQMCVKVRSVFNDLKYAHVEDKTNSIRIDYSAMANFQFLAENFRREF